MTEEQEKTSDDTATEEDGFWNAKAPAAEEKEREITEELDESAMGAMKLKSPKPVFTTPTKCKILGAKFFKVDKTEKDSRQVDYTPFQVTVTYAPDGNDAAEFKETYRGGRLYANPNGTSIYIGPASALGRFKASCIEGGIKVGDSIKDFAISVVDVKCILKSETVMFGGKKFDKNYIQSIVKD
ncbi:MAG: hypothetical protein D4S01_08840 [Dehalococcoidia bacterium]|nr:MAG: hypothetical protein D4S01_08840 [Dehalococcoidia bacterium]